MHFFTTTYVFWSSLPSPRPQSQPFYCWLHKAFFSIQFCFVLYLYWVVVRANLLFTRSMLFFFPTSFLILFAWDNITFNWGIFRPMLNMPKSLVMTFSELILNAYHHHFISLYSFFIIFIVFSYIYLSIYLLIHSYCEDLVSL